MVPVPPDEVYTLQLAAAGELAAGLSCNRGAGRWTSPSAGESRGVLEIRLLAVSQAACAPSPVKRLADDLGCVRSFVIQDGRLHLNLKIDSGDYVWEPAP